MASGLMSSAAKAGAASRRRAGKAMRKREIIAMVSSRSTVAPFRLMMDGPGGGRHRSLAKQTSDRGGWLGWRRPLLVAFAPGCTMSLSSGGRMLAWRADAFVSPNGGFVLRVPGPLVVLVDRSARHLVFRPANPGIRFHQDLAGRRRDCHRLVGLHRLLLLPIRCGQESGARLPRLGVTTPGSWTPIIAIFGGPAIPPKAAARFGP